MSSLTKEMIAAQWACDSKVGVANCTIENADGSVLSIAPASFLATSIALRASGVSATASGVHLDVEFSLGDAPVSASVGLVVSQGSPAGSSGSVNSGAGSGVASGPGVSSNVPVTSVVSQPGFQGPLSVEMTTDGSTTFTQGTDRFVVIDHSTQYTIPGGVADDVVLPDGLSTTGVSSDGWVCPAGSGTIRCEHAGAVTAAGSRLSVPVHVAADAPLGFALGAVASKSLDGVLAHQGILSLTIASVTGATAPPADPISSGFTVSPALVASGPVSVATLTVRNAGGATTGAPVTTLKVPASLVATSDDPACVVTDGFENTTTVVCTAKAALAAGTEANPAASAPMVFHLAVADDTTATTAAISSNVTVDGRTTKDTASGLPIAPAVVRAESIPTARTIPQVYARELLDAPVTALDVSVPGAPTSVTATSGGNGQSVVSWTAPESNGGGAITSYDVTAVSAPTVVVFDWTDLQWWFDGLQRHAGYWTGSGYVMYRITVPAGVTTLDLAYVAGFAGTNYREVYIDDVLWKSRVEFPETGDWTTPVTAPLGSIELSEGTHYVKITNDAGSSNPDYLMMDPYYLLVGHRSDGCSTTATSCTATGLMNGTSYNFTVTATNASGTSAASAPSDAVIPSTVPNAPTGVSATSGSNGQTVVTWTAPESNGSAISGYTVFANPSPVVGEPSYAPIQLTDLGTYYDGPDRFAGWWWGAGFTQYEITVPGGDVELGLVYTLGFDQTNYRSVYIDGVLWNPHAEFVRTGGWYNKLTAPLGTVNLSAGTHTIRVTNDENSDPINPGPLAVRSGSAPSCTTEATSCTITGLTNGTSYNFTVTATNGSGTSEASDPSGAAIPSTIPGAPTGVSATTGEVSQSVVSWTAPSSDGGGAITDYTVVATPASTNVLLSSTDREIIHSGEGLNQYVGGWGGSGYVSYTFTATAGQKTIGLAYAAGGGTQYRAVYVDGNLWDWHSEFPGTPDWSRSVVKTIGSLELSAGEHTITFTNEENTGPIDAYYLLVSAGVSSSCNTPYTSCVVGGLTNGVAYTFTVTATNASGSSAASTPSAPVTPVATVPSVPTGVTATGAENGQVSVRWNTPDTNGGSAITQYTVTSSPGGFTCTTTSTSCAVTGLSNGTSYTFTVTATNAVGTSEAAAASASAVPSTVPGAPRGVSAVAGNGSASVSWTAPASNGGADITSYTVTSSGTPVTSNVLMSSTDQVLQSEGLGQHTAFWNGPGYAEYTFTVPGGMTSLSLAFTAGRGVASRAILVDGVIWNPRFEFPGTRDWSNPDTVLMGSTVLSAGTHTVRLRRDESSSNYINNYYLIVGYGQSSCTTTTLSCTVLGLPNGTSYTFTVKATNASGTGPVSAASSSVSPTLSSPPGAPTGVAATSGMNGQVSVGWTAPASNGGSPITSYTVTSSPGGFTCTTSGGYCGVTGLTNGVSYTFTVTATNASGTGAASAVSPVAVPSTTPGAPTGVSATSGRNGQSVVSWTAPLSNGGGVITTYDVTGTSASTNVIFDSTDLQWWFDGLDRHAGWWTGSGYVMYRITVPAGLTTLDLAYAAGYAGTNYREVYVDDVLWKSRVEFPSTGNWTTPVRAPLGSIELSAGTHSVKITNDAGSSNPSYLMMDPYYLVVGHGSSSCTTSTTSCTVTGLTNGASYTFTVKANNASGPSDASAASASVIPSTVPGAPTGVTATSGANSQSVVSWSAPVSNGGAAITGYTVTSSPGSFSCTSGSTSCTVTGLTNGTSYTFTVVATNASGTGSASVASAGATPSTVPGAPTGVTATSGANSQSVVSWSAPVSNGGAAITGYTVTSSPGSFQCTTATTSCTVVGLTNGTGYTFTVTATNNAGTGSASSASAAVVPSTTPGAPTSVSATSNANAQSVVSWSAPVSNGGAAITGYMVTSSPGSFSCTSGSTSCTVTGLTNGTSYTFAVVATNASGTGSASVASAAVTPSTVPGAPTSVSATSGANSQSVVSWSAPVSNGGSSITGYTVTSSPGSLTCTTATTSCTVTGLTNGTSYTFTVTATNVNGTGAASSASAAGVPSTVPGAPTSVSATSGANSQSVVSWTAPASNGGASITSYMVTSSPGSFSCTSSSTSCTVTGLTNGTAYTFTVVATNASGAGSPSTASAAATPSTTPGAPTGVSATSGANAQSVVSWTAPVSNGGAAISGYTVTSSPGSFQCTTATTSCTVVGLTNGTSYTFTVVATNASGAGSASTASAAATPSTTPGAPTGVSATRNANAQSVVSWTAPVSNGGGVVTSYMVTSSPGSFQCTTATTSCTVSGLTNGTSYTFTVVATNASGNGSASTPSASVVPLSAPGAPTGVIATSAVNGQSVVSWTAPLSNGGSAITRYTVMSSPGAKSCVTNGATSCRVVGLTNGTAYTFTVTATNISGTGSASRPSAKAVPSTVPGAPTGVRATSGENAQSSVSWTMPVNDGGAAVTGYDVLALPVPMNVLVSSTDLSLVGDGLDKHASNWTESGYVSYSITVPAGLATLGLVYAAGAGTAYRAVYVDDVLLNQHVEFPGTSGTALTTSSVGSVELSAGTHIVRFSNDDDFGALNPYYLVVSVGNISSCSTSTTSCTVADLTNDISYTFTVTATNVSGTGPVSNPSEAATPMLVPDAPTGVSATSATNGKATVSWTAPVSTGGALPTGYTVTSSPGSLTCSTASTSCIVTGLTNGVSYTFSVTATNAAGAGPASIPSLAVTPTTVPGAPTGVSATSGANGQSVVSWTAPSSNGGAAITGYEVVATPEPTHVLMDSTDLQTVGAGLELHADWEGWGYVSYRFTVPGGLTRLDFTFREAGTAARSIYIDGVLWKRAFQFSGTTWFEVKSTTLGSIELSAGDHEVRITNDDGYGPFSAYYLDVRSGSSSSCSSTTTSCTVTGLTNGTSYAFTVTASNVNGTGAASSTSAPVVPSTVPGTPTGVSATSNANAQSVVSWTAPASNGGSPITGYTVTSSPGSLSCATVTTSCTVTGLTNGTSYTFTVTATNAAGTGSASAASAPAIPSTVPGAPTGVSAVAGNGSASVSWTAPASNGGAAITSYTVTSSGTPVTSNVLMSSTDQVLQSEGLAQHTAFWNGPGYAEYSFTVPGGMTKLSLAYTAGRGVASRAILVDGVVWNPRFEFPGTRDWSNTDTALMGSIVLSAGAHTVRLLRDDN